MLHIYFRYWSHPARKPTSHQPFVESFVWIGVVAYLVECSYSKTASILEQTLMQWQYALWKYESDIDLQTAKQYRSAVFAQINHISWDQYALILSFRDSNVDFSCDAFSITFNSKQRWFRERNIFKCKSSYIFEVQWTHFTVMLGF